MTQVTSLCFARKSFIVIALTTLVLGCSTSPTKTTKTEQTTPVATPISEDADVNISAQHYLQQAENAQPMQAIELLVRASEQYLYEQKYHQALWLATQNSALITAAEQTASLSANQDYRLSLIKAQALLALNDFDRATTQLNDANELKQKHQLSHQYAYYKTLSQVEAVKNNQVAAIEAQLHAFALNSQASSDDVWQIWQQLTQISTWQVNQLNQTNAPQVKGWTQLLSYAQKFGANVDQLSRYLNQWQRTNTNHPAQLVVADMLTNDISDITSHQHVAVLLPLSGKQKAAGLSAQHGILMAYQNQPEKELHFIDTNELDMASLSLEFEQLSIDAVIGPLLKSNVEQYLQQSELTLPTLLLNIPEQAITAKHISAFSMRPEDEAIQAATVLSNKQYQHPVVLTHNDATSARIANSFTQQWQKITGKMPETLTFERGRKMQDEIKASLEVDRSLARIKELNTRLKQNIKYESRNRRDVDMIYLIGTPQESRLLKPYIDVNISPFAKLIPVYASSRSHSAVADASVYNDLYGLTFTEIPWLLPSKQQNSLLAQQSDALWPQQSVTLKRIFAMGYDSYALIDKLAAMKAKPYVRHFGQTGTLQLTQNNILTRSLLWGNYRKNKVQEIVLD
ncbi:penicillin-binding protein activator [Thalassotalea sp. PLHSN55]|uniref:penicillin-binding protein activator n=1 Tax=Thalassotalea sp. PLHSN55 TaxID=3435888 RepID=UPI003F8369F7